MGIRTIAKFGLGIVAAISVGYAVLNGIKTVQSTRTRNEIYHSPAMREYNSALREMAEPNYFSNARQTRLSLDRRLEVTKKARELAENTVIAACLDDARYENDNSKKYLGQTFAVLGGASLSLLGMLSLTRRKEEN